jgi:hypothetical protein
LCNCCTFALHQDRIRNLNLLTPLAQRWQDEIQRNLDQAVIDLRAIPSLSVGSQLPYDLRSRRAEISIDPTSNRSTSIYQPPLSEFQPHIEKPSLGDSVCCKLLECLQAGEERDFETGSLYIYHRDSSPGYVKIGWTANSVWGRLESWAEKCGYRPNILFSVHEIPHAHRVETLTHYELIKNWRRERKCKKEDCQISHQEWFEISKEQAMLVLISWSIFMSTAKPYDAEGELKDEWKKAVAKIDGNGEAVTAQMLLKLHAELSAEEKQPKIEPIQTEPPSGIEPLLQTKLFQRSAPSHEEDTPPTPPDTKYSTLDISATSSQASLSMPPARTNPPEDLTEQIAAIRQGIEELKLLMRDSPPRKDAKMVSDQAESPATENEPTWKEEDATLIDEQLAPGLLLEKEVATTLDGLATDVTAAKANAVVTAVKVLATEVPLKAQPVTVQA